MNTTIPEMYVVALFGEPVYFACDSHHDCFVHLDPVLADIGLSSEEQISRLHDPDAHYRHLEFVCRYDDGTQKPGHFIEIDDYLDFLENIDPSELEPKIRKKLFFYLTCWREEFVDAVFPEGPDCCKECTHAYIKENAEPVDVMITFDV